MVSHEGLTVQFRAKVRSVWNHDGTLAWRYVDVPSVKRSHCDMNAFRCSRRFGGYANSDLFLGMMRRELAERKISGMLRMDQLPEGVIVDESGFLAVVTVVVAD